MMCGCLFASCIVMCASLHIDPTTHECEEYKLEGIYWIEKCNYSTNLHMLDQQ